MKLPKEQWRVLDRGHAKRNQVEYAGTATVEIALVEAMLRAARELEARVIALAASS